MARADKAEQRQTMRADRDWWSAFGDLFGWELLDSTHRYRAKFCIDDVTTIEISARARADIEEALARAAAAKGKVLGGRPPIARRSEKVPSRR